MRALLAACALLSTTPLLARAEGVRDCQKEDVDAWKKLRDETLGVAPAEPSPNLLPDGVPPPPGISAEEACPNVVDFSLRQDGRVDDGIHAWILADACRQTTCAWPVNLETNKGMFWLSGEYDLNNNVELKSSLLERKFNDHACFAYQGAKSAVQALKAQSAPVGAAKATKVQNAYQYPHLCFPPTETVHVEITPPPGARRALRALWAENYPANFQVWRNTLGDSKVCVRGPFVGDNAHSLKAEIHPAGQVWWNENLARPSPPLSEEAYFKPDGPFALLFLQDASGRYNRRQQYVLTQPPPPNGTWRPWAEGPLSASFLIAFFAPSKGTVDFLIQEYGSKQLLSSVLPDSPAVRITPAEVEDGQGGKTRVALVMSTANPRHVEPQPAILCRCTSATCGNHDGYLATLKLNLTVGRTGDWEEGHLALRVRDQRQPASGGVSSGPPPDKPLEPCLTPVSVVIWKPREDPKTVAALRPEENQQARAEIDWMFTESGWQDGVPHPYPILQSLGNVELRARVGMQGALEKQEKRLRPQFKWLPTTDCQQRPGTGTCEGPTIPPADAKKETITLDLRQGRARPPESSGAWQDRTVRRIVAQLLLTPRPGMPTAASSCPRLAEETALWSVWSHGFLAAPAAQWRQVADTLCGPKITDAKKDRTRLSHDLDTLVSTIARDGFVSMDELGDLINRVPPLCERWNSASPPAQAALEKR